MWRRAPVLMQALLAGLAVTGTATVVWGVLIEINLRFLRRLPWAAGVMAVFLIFYWKYLKGWGWPQATSLARSKSLRAGALSAGVWRWSLGAGGMGLAASVALFAIAHRLIAWPQTSRADLSKIPIATLLITLLMSAAVAGISEEAGFRGYMQRKLELRYGPALGIAMASFVFGLSHLNHTIFVPAILFDIGWGALYGTMTYLSGSIVPAIILHSSADAIEFMVAWRFPTTGALPLVWTSGPDSLFWFNCVLSILLGGGAVWSFRQLARGSLEHSFMSN